MLEKVNMCRMVLRHIYIDCNTGIYILIVIQEYIY